ncbi:MAG: S4 domain-containing protein [Gemmatimonadetes bacterium]|nr:S4 domain-containing protein [Gemmatimonadota bacterium]
MNEVRLDRWLWATRFFKTRRNATEAIEGGKVHLNGRRTKKSKALKLGDELRIRKGPYESFVTVTGLAEKRRSAKEAVLLYEESEESRAAREKLRLQMRSAPVAEFKHKGRPTKKERRELDRLRDEVS